MPGIAVLNLGGQYCHLIARRVRDLGVFADILSVLIQPLTSYGISTASFSRAALQAYPSPVRPACLKPC